MDRRGVKRHFRWAYIRPIPRKISVTRKMHPLDMYREVNTGCNLPAQIDLYAVDGMEYKFLFIAKGGGSANKTYLYQETKALITPDKLVNFLVEKMKTLGTAACPPYHIAFVIGGTSAEMNLKTVKLASAKYYDNLPTSGNELGHAFRDIELEKEVLRAAQESGIGAQFGGKYFAHDVRIIRRRDWRVLSRRVGCILFGRPEYQGQNQSGRSVDRTPR